MQNNGRPFQSQQPPGRRMISQDKFRRISDYPPIHSPSSNKRNSQFISSRKNIPQQITPKSILKRQSLIHNPYTRNTDSLHSLSSIKVESPTLRDNFRSLFKQKKDFNKTKKRRNKNSLRRAFLLVCGCLAIPLLLGLLLALLLGLLYRPHSTTTTITTTVTTTTTTTETTTSTTSTSTTSTTTSVTTSTSSATTSTTSETTTTTSSTSTTTESTTSTSSTTSTTSTTTTTSTSTSTTTTTAFSCASTVTSTLASYKENICVKNTWHTFSKSFVASYTGIRTLVFSFTNIFHAEMYLANIKVRDASNVDLLSNGDFASSSGTIPTNWLKCSDNGSVSSSCSVAASIACYTLSTDGGTISQSFPVVSGTNYTVTFDLYHISTNGNSGTITLDVSAV